MPVGDSASDTIERKSLTERERQILEKIIQGSSTKEIARALHLSPRTVGVHRQHILHKTGARNAIDLVRRTLAHEDA